MPLRARAGDTELISLDLTREAFSALKGRTDLTMACCDARAIAKRSVNGLPFFAHGRARTCPSGPETEFHLRGKLLIRDAARTAQWNAQVEVPGRTPDGIPWRADVLCNDGTRHVAFELQRSGLTLDTLAERQARYRQSGVRAMWFMRTREKKLRDPQPWQQATPALYVTEQHHVPVLDAALPEAVHLALTGGLTLFPLPGVPTRLSVVTNVHTCRRCRTPIHVLAATLLAPAGKPDAILHTPWNAEGLADWVTGVLTRTGHLTRPIMARKAHIPNIGAIYPCRECGQYANTYSKPKDAVSTWYKSAIQGLSYETMPGLVEHTVIRSGILTLTRQEVQTYASMIGQQWTRRAWLHAPPSGD